MYGVAKLGQDRSIFSPSFSKLISPPPNYITHLDEFGQLFGLVVIPLALPIEANAGSEGRDGNRSTLRRASTPDCASAVSTWLTSDYCGRRASLRKASKYT